MSAPVLVASPLHDQPPADVVARLVPGARTEIEPGPFGWRSLRLVAPGLDLRLRDTGLADAAQLRERIAAMKRDVVALTPSGPTAPAFRLHRFVGRARHVVDLEGLQVQTPAHQSFVFDYARLVFGVAKFPRGFVDSEARWILDANGRTADGAGPREVPEARARRARTIESLARVGVRIPDGLSLVESEREALTCSAADAKRRALALYRTFRETCGAPELAVEHDDAVAAYVEEELTPREREAIAKGDRSHAGMGVEALWALLFALGAAPSLAPLGADCDAEAALDTLDALTARGPLDDGSLRPLPEILDALDQHQCLAWALADRRGALPAPMKGYVVQMRLRALRWVVMDQFAEWDEVALDA